MKVPFSSDRGHRTEDIMFDVVDMPYPYNAFLGRRVINKFLVVIHHGYLCMKLPDPKGIITVYGDQAERRLVGWSSDWPQAKECLCY